MAMFISKPSANPLCLPPDEMKEFDSLSERLKNQWAINRDIETGSFIFYYVKPGCIFPETLIIRDYTTLADTLKHIIEEEREMSNV